MNDSGEYLTLPESFSDLISGRGFDRFQTGLIARWRAHRIGYDLNYGRPTSKPSMTLDFTTNQGVGRVTLWESGECDLEVLDCATGGHLLEEHHEFANPNEFFATYPKVPLLLRKLRGDISLELE
jgi:hypothetical protein